MADILYDRFADEQKLEEQRKFVLDIFKQIKEGISDLAKSGIKIDSAAGLRPLIEGIAKQKKAQDDLGLAVNQYNKLLSQKAILEAKVAASTSQQAKVLTELSDKVKANNKLQKERIALSKAEEGSIDQLQLKVAKATRIYESLGEAQRSSARGQQLLKFIQDTGKELGTLEQKTGNFRRNVGNYANSLADGFKRVTDEIAKLREKQQGLQQGLQDYGSGRNVVEGFQTKSQMEEELRRTTQAIGQLEATAQIGFQTNTTYAQSVKQIEKAYQEMAVSGTQSTEFLQDFKRFAAESKNQADSLRKEIKLLSSDTRSFDLLSGSINTLVSGFEAAAGAAALFGNDSEDVARSIQKLVAIQAVANGVREVANQLTTRGTAANKAYAFVQTQVAVATNASATATARLSAVLKLAGIGLLIAGIGFLADKLGLFSSNANKSQKELEKFKAEIDATKKSIDNFNTSIDRTNTITKLRIQLEGGTEVQELQQDIIAAQTKLANLQPKVDAAMKASIKAAIEFEKSATDANKAAAESAETAYQDLSAQRTNLIDEIAQTSIRIDISRKATAAKSKEQAEKDAEDAAKRIKDRVEAEKKAALELFLFEQDLIAKQAEFESSKDSILSVNDRVEAAKKEFEARKAAILAQQKFDLEQENITKSGTILINKKAALAIEELERDLQNRIVKIRVEAFQRTRAEAQAGVDDFEKDMEDRATRELQQAQEQFKKRNALAEKFRAEEIESVNKNLQDQIAAAGGSQEKIEAAIKDANDRKLEIEFQYQKSLLTSQIAFYEAQIKQAKALGNDTTDLETALSNARIALSDLVTDKIISNNGKQVESEQEKISNLEKGFEKIRNISEKLTGLAGDYLNSITTREQNAIQDQIDNIERLKAAEIERINSSTDSEEKKAARIKVIEAKAQADREALERRQRQIRQREAAFEKAASITQIILNTAEAVTKALAKGRVDQAVLAGAIGAAQLAIAIATPIPRFAKGKKASDTYTGPGIWGEAGQEMKISRRGKITLSGDGPSLTELMPGDTILPAQATRDILRAAEMQHIATFKHYHDMPVKDSRINGLLIEKYEEQTRILKRIESKQMVVVNEIHNDAEWNAYIEKQTRR